MRYEVEIEALEDVGVVAVEASVHGLARTALALGADLPDGARAVPFTASCRKARLHRCGPESPHPDRHRESSRAPPLAARLGDVLDEASAIVADLSDRAWLGAVGGRSTRCPYSHKVSQ